MQGSFEKNHTLTIRHNEYLRIRKEHPDRIPVICEKAPGGKSTDVLSKIKYLVPEKMYICEFMIIIKKSLKMSSSEALFFMSGGTMLSGHMHLGDVHETNKSKDGFLYITYSEENVFGN